MTRKDFELIAETIRELSAEHGANSQGFNAEEGEQIAKAFANRLASTNPNFDRARFLSACGVEG